MSDTIETRISPIRNAINHMEVDEKRYVGPYARSQSVYSCISKYGGDKEFAVRKLNAIDANFTEINKDVYEIRRIK